MLFVLNIFIKKSIYDKVQRTNIVDKQLPSLMDIYRRKGYYVFTCVCLSVCLSVCQLAG